MHKTHYVTCNINNIANNLNYIATAGLDNTLKYPERCRLLNATGWMDWTQTVGPSSATLCLAKVTSSLCDKHNCGVVGPDGQKVTKSSLLRQKEERLPLHHALSLS